MKRTFYAAAHVVATSDTDIDWDATLAFRRHLWSLGLGVADAMDTAQRGMGLPWDATQQLIKLSAAEAGSVGGLLACGVGTDQLPAGSHPLAKIEAAYRAQLEVVQSAGAGAILMASRALAASAKSEKDYHTVYGNLLSQVDAPVILHWLGEMFDPQLEGYWGPNPDESVLELIHNYASKVDGVKVSVLDADREIALRSKLPDGVKLYTGDDFNYPSLIESGSHALLGIFDAIAVPAARAREALDAGDTAGFRAILDPTVPLARHIFEAPTYNYKTGIVYLAWLNGHQEHFHMVGGLQTARSKEHLDKLYRLALEAGVITDLDLAAARHASLA
ncbi:dihydrodipicolinate synthase family protein [Allorhizocola rhizosphaerae]|uniref:dihydrodipicolinate synthase family protein n=1 Tax=Allorhizocola rhizosphaerae TaxID=1872709 RepID=UPI000E3E5292|nr:dihydrodipicolinate synthase family protein [Allorhizocola rhizosphaerae]